MERDGKVSSILSWLDDACKLVSNHGLWKILKGLFVICVSVLAFYFVSNPRWIFDKFEGYKEEAERENLEYRRNVNGQIQEALRDFINSTGAVRACILEFHNGKNSAGQLGFYYAEMTYEMAKQGVARVAPYYKEVSLSLFNISDIVYKNGFWYGNIKDDLDKIDPGLACMINESGTTWAATMLLQGSVELGLLVVSFDTVPDDPRWIGRETRKLGSMVAGMLDYCSYEESGQNQRGR